MSRFSLRATALAATLLSMPLGACVAQVSERQFIRPVPGGTLTAEVLSAATPSYALTTHSIASADGVTLHAVYLRQPGAKVTVIYFGGNNYTIERFGAKTAAFFAPLGVDVFIADHRGYGLSQGKPTAAALEADGLAVFDYLSGLPSADPVRIVLHGQSLGSFTAGNVAANRPAAGVVLESSVTTTEDWVEAQTAGMPIKVKIDEALKGRGNLSKMAAIEEPLLLLVGSLDKTTPARFSEALYKASSLPPEQKFLKIVEGASHHDVLTKPEAATTYAEFLRRIADSQRP